MKLLIVDLDYVIENNELLARIFGRSESGSREIVKIRGTRPFFCVPATEPIPSDKRIIEIQDGWTDLKGNPLKQIFAKYPKDIAQRIKCKGCSGLGEVVINGTSTDCPDCEGEGQIEVGLKSFFRQTFQADVVYTQVLRIYYGLIGTIEVPSNICNITDVKNNEKI